MKIKVGIIGGAGYTGGETLRLLLLHPNVKIVFVHSKSQTGQPVTSVHNDCLGLTNLKFTDKLNTKVDVLFLCLGHGEAKKFLQENNIPAKIKIIDLSQDFRHKQTNAFQKRKFVYGLPELNKEAIKKADNIANPGCFATCIQLALLPLAKHHNINSEVHVSAITGSTGAGQSLSETSHFSWRQNNVSPYKVFEHQHLKEITESLQQLLLPQTPKGALSSVAHSKQNNSGSPFRGLGHEEPKIHFVPYRGPFTRGILATVYLKSGISAKDANNTYTKFYKSSPFVHVAPFEVDVKQVVNTNNCFLSVNKIGTELVIVSAIDNLLKGAAGQAVQNMNLIFGLPEDAGLKLKAVAF